MATVKDLLSKIRERDTELNFRAQKTEEYLQQCPALDAEKAANLFKAMEALNLPRIKPENLVKFVDLLPQSPEEVKLLLQGSPLTIAKENVQKIVDTVKKAVSS